MNIKMKIMYIKHLLNKLLADLVDMPDLSGSASIKALLSTRSSLLASLHRLSLLSLPVLL